MNQRRIKRILPIISLLILIGTASAEIETQDSDLTCEIIMTGKGKVPEDFNDGAPFEKEFKKASKVSTPEACLDWGSNLAQFYFLNGYILLGADAIQNGYKGEGYRFSYAAEEGFIYTDSENPRGSMVKAEFDKIFVQTEVTTIKAGEEKGILKTTTTYTRLKTY